MLWSLTSTDNGKLAEKLGRKTIGPLIWQPVPKGEFFVSLYLSRCNSNDKGKPIEKLGRKTKGSYQ